MIDIVFEERQSIPYGNLNIGDVFCWREHVYMLTDKNNMDDSPLSVDLEYGIMENFGRDTEVQKYDNAKLILR